MPTITRDSAREAIEYCQKVFEEKDYQTPPTSSAYRAISSHLDDSIFRSYNQTVQLWSATKSAKKGYSVLAKAPRTCGGFASNPLLKGYTPFEQMQVVGNYVEKKGRGFTQQRTFSLAQDDEYVPIQIKVPRNTKKGATPWTTVIGTTRGALKAPSYSDWAKEDPRHTPKSCLISPLDHLEIFRAPKCAATTVMKADLFGHRIDHERRYQFLTQEGDYFKGACAELPKQHTKKTTLVKQNSAGFNLHSLVSSSRLRNRNILPKTICYEDYYEDGYDDHASPTVTPKKILKAVEEALNGTPENLDKEMSKLFANQLSISENKTMRSHTRRVLFK